MRAAALALALLACALTGCETSAEKSAKIEKVAKREARIAAAHRPKPLVISHPSRVAHVTSAMLLHSSEGTAALVSIANTSASAIRDAPIAITVRDASGAALYTNTTPGLAATLASVPLLPAHSTSVWIDDQVQAAGVPVSVRAVIGEGVRGGDAAALTVGSSHLSEGAVEGELVNHSAVEQREVVVYALARRGGRIVAAGRAVVPEAPARGSTHFQVFFIGSPQGAQLQLRAVSGAGGAA